MNKKITSLLTVLFAGTALLAQTASVLTFNFDGNYNDVSDNAFVTATIGDVGLTADKLGKPNQALNSASGAVKLASNTGTYKVTFPFTFSAWVSMNTIGTVNPIFTSEDDQTSYSGMWVQILNDGKVAANVGNGGAPNSSGRKSAITNAAVITQTNTWYQIVVIAKSISDFSIYVNGVLQGSTLSGDATSMVYKNGVDNVAKIGVYNKGTGTNYYFNGAIDNMNLWAAELSGDQLTALLQEGSGNVSSVEFSPETEYSVYPNPFTSVVTLNIPSVNKVVVMDAAGKAVYSAYSLVSQIDLSSLNAGMYFMNIYSDEALQTVKVLKQ